MKVKKWEVGKTSALYSALHHLQDLKKCESPFYENDCNYGLKPCPYSAICRAAVIIQEEIDNPSYVEYIEIPGVRENE